MEIKDRKRPAKIDKEAVAKGPQPKSVVGGPQGRAGARRLMTREERLRFFDEIRSRTRSTLVDSTEIIRRGRDGDDF